MARAFGTSKGAPSLTKSFNMSQIRSAHRALSCCFNIFIPLQRNQALYYNTGKIFRKNDLTLINVFQGIIQMAIILSEGIAYGIKVR